MDEKNTDNVRISKKLINYIKLIQERFMQEYDIKVAFTEASNLLAGRAKEKKLF